MNKAWVERIMQQCAEQHVLFFFKQWGGVQKSKAGRLLNGVTFDAMPDRLVAPIPPRKDRLALASEFQRSIPILMTQTQPLEQTSFLIEALQQPKI
jgi:hypothetical protein